MFHPVKGVYKIKKVPGFIHVPFDFTPAKLKEYAEGNIAQARDHAREYVKS